MTRDAFLMSNEPIARGALGRVARAERAAWLIDAGRARVLAANRAGLVRLSLRRDGSNASLDAAMPALRRLREIGARGGPRTLKAERLVFWTGAGTAAITCDVVVARGKGPLVVMATGEGTTNQGRDTAAAAPLLRELAHELRTPLSAIAAAAEIMRDERLGPLTDPRYKSYAGDVHEAALHALAVVERLLTGDAPGGGAHVDVNAMARSLAAQLAPLAERARVRIGLDLASRAPAVAANATELRQMVLNLVTNALKFTPAGGSVTIATRLVRGSPVVEVRDSGLGMSKREISEALDAKREPVSGPRRGGGYGIGLPLVRRLAEANDARLAIESRRGKGTRAQIVFARPRRKRG